MGTEYDAMRSIEARIAALEQRMELLTLDSLRLKSAMEANTEALKEYIELSKNLKVGLKFLGYVEGTAGWFIKVGGAAAVVWASWRFLIKEALKL